MLAHAEVYHLYDSKYRKTSPNGEGKISFTCISQYGEPEDRNDPEHIAAADRYLQFYIGWFYHPIFSEQGDYPKVMREYIDKRSDSEKSRLPKFTPEEIERIKGTADFMGVQHRDVLISNIS